jgi:hypothetical protein
LIFAAQFRRRPPSGREVWILYLGGYSTDAWAHSKISNLLTPQLGPYSSHNHGILKKHVALIRQSGVDALVSPWHGSDSDPANTTYSDETLDILFALAANAGLGILPLILHHDGRTTESVRERVDMWQAQYGRRSAEIHGIFFLSTRELLLLQQGMPILIFIRHL